MLYPRYTQISEVLAVRSMLHALTAASSNLILFACPAVLAHWPQYQTTLVHARNGPSKTGIVVQDAKSQVKTVAFSTPEVNSHAAVPSVSPTNSRAQSALLQRAGTALASASEALSAPVTPSQLPPPAADDSVKKRKRDKPKKKNTTEAEIEQKQPEKAKKRKVAKTDGSKQTSGTGNAGEAAELRVRLGFASSPAATLATPAPAPFSFGFGFQSPQALASTPPPAALFQAHVQAM